MKLYSCPACRALIYFENSACLACGAALAFDPACDGMVAVAGRPVRRCAGGDPACNWLVADGDAEARCMACRTTQAAPGPGDQRQRHWSLLEQAKRRVLRQLLALGLPLGSLCFAFPDDGVTGHADGLITVLLPEADDVERERRRVALGEPARTLIGHFRHEVGHFYWDRLVRDGGRLEAVRPLFGDERADYQEALAAHYRAGPPPDWNQRFISAYASSHPWEDWAETWAHVLHMLDAVEIAAAYGLTIAPHPDAAGPAEAPVHASLDLRAGMPLGFEDLLAAWYPLSWLANSLNRSAGLRDWYPYSPAPAVLAKLAAVHGFMRTPPAPQPPPDQKR